jgi:hypothetical protein
MAKLTLLQIVQSILSDMESDEVTDIADTPESEQVASTVRDVYFQMITNKIIPEHHSLVSLTNAGGTAKTFMLIPATVARIQEIWYNKIKTGETRVQYAKIPYMPPDEFLAKSFELDSTASDVTTATDPTSSLTIYVLNDEGPSYWTSFDDEYVCFNSYDAVVDASGLTAAKTRCSARIIPTWTHTSAGIPDMDENLFPMLLAEAKSTCFVNLKQTANAKIEQQVRQQKVSYQHDKYRTKASQEKSFSSPGYSTGRKRR